MRAIYQPTGRAREYADLAINIYEGCPHGCLYCFNKYTPWYDGEKFCSAKPREGIVEAVKRDLAKLPIDAPKILLCFSCDPYPRTADTSTTRAVLEELVGRRVSVLTKGGVAALRDFDLLEKETWEFGQSIGIHSQKLMDVWEHGAAPFDERLEMFIEAKKRGIWTWASVEPVIDPDEALECIYTCLPYVDYWKIGKTNHVEAIRNKCALTDFREPDWKEYLARVRVALGGRPCMVKKDLLVAAGVGMEDDNG